MDGENGETFCQDIPVVPNGQESGDGKVVASQMRESADETATDECGANLVPPMRTRAAACAGLELRG